MRPLTARVIFLSACVASGFAGLVYEVTWTRLLTLYMGQTAATVSTVVAAFMGGLAGGAVIGGAIGGRLSSRRALHAYAALEIAAALFALFLPRTLASIAPSLGSLYHEGHGAMGFIIARVSLCLSALLVPALALGATFPLAVQWFVRDRNNPGGDTGAVYAANTTGAALGSIAAGFVLIPAAGLWGTTLIGAAASGAAATTMILLGRAGVDSQPPLPVRRSKPHAPGADARSSDVMVATMVLATSGFAALVIEITWVRLVSLLTGPTTYAFASVLLVMIGGIALGATIGAWQSARVGNRPLWLSLVMSATSIATSWTAVVAGRDLPRWLIATSVGASLPFNAIAFRAFAVAVSLTPIAIGLGFAFPLGLGLAAGRGQLSRRVGLVYGVNTVASLVGSLTAGLLFIPWLSLHPTLRISSAALLGGGLVAALGASRGRGTGFVGSALALIFVTSGPAWDRELLASGLYKYATSAPIDLDPAVLLKAGDTLYYRDGAAATVSVRRLTGTVSMSIDGKVDASSVGDMLTQKLLAHIPLLLHPNPRRVLVIGLGSGVTASSALTHGIERVDIVEISPEVVDASDVFSAQNRNVLRDSRTNLIVGDGRAHLLLSRERYDVIVSEPSNPWMAGVSALFTREFFAAARQRLAPGGIICQWAHTYDISDADLRSIVGTFASVFPAGTLWLVGEGDLLLVASDAPMDGRLGAIADTWRRPLAGIDLHDVGANEPFAVLSLYAGGPAEMTRYAGSAVLQTDDKMALEFTGPRALNTVAARSNGSVIRGLLSDANVPSVVQRSLSSARGEQWRDRGLMLLRIEDYEDAYHDYTKALSLSLFDNATLDGYVRAASGAGRGQEATVRLRVLIDSWPDATSLRVAASRLLASNGSMQDAIDVLDIDGPRHARDGALLEQFASISVDAADATSLHRAVARLREVEPDSARTAYFAASAAFIDQRFADAADLASRAIALDASRADAYNLRGVSLASLGQVDAARRGFREALSRAPREATAYANLGLLELNSGNPQGALKLFAEALTLDPGSPVAREGLTRAVAQGSADDRSAVKQ